MAKQAPLTGKDLRNLGFPEGPVISITLNTLAKHHKRTARDVVFAMLSEILTEPTKYTEDEVMGPIAKALLPKARPSNLVDLRDTGIPYEVYGAEGIEEGAQQQMRVAAKLPVAVAGALMPDAHHGYGLPIGGVLATDNAVIPYGVGVDIGCRMCLSIFDLPPGELDDRTSYFSREIHEATLFGSGGIFKRPHDHEVMERVEFGETALLRQLKERARQQLGTSGSGNHFVEFGVVEIGEGQSEFGVPAGKYVGLLSHSGSRALGANVAAHYTKLAKEKRALPPEAANLAWLSLDEEEGIEYWRAMNLAGDYASANHHIIHEKIAKQLGRQPLKRVENHHNFAWKEQHNGREVIVHRKGATPAGKGVLGIIPGSMTAPGFIVRGKGEEASVASASHGAGRRMSRTAALQKITQSELKEELKARGVTLLGGGLDEAPFAYKDIHAVMAGQRALVDVVGTFQPKIVKMCGDAPRGGRKGGGGKSKVADGE
jgi:tRNA-splicing ligase RtcB